MAFPMTVQRALAAPIDFDQALGEAQALCVMAVGADTVSEALRLAAYRVALALDAAVVSETGTREAEGQSCLYVFEREHGCIHLRPRDAQAGSCGSWISLRHQEDAGPGLPPATLDQLVTFLMLDAPRIYKELSS